MSTRHELLLLLRKQPGATVAELAGALDLTGMGVRRHLDALARDGKVETTTPATAKAKVLGRPAAGWRLTATGLELFPRRYDGFALDLLEDVAEHAGAPAVDAVLECRTDKLADRYEAALSCCGRFEQRVAELARLRDEAGYLAEWEAVGDGEAVLTENNCAVHRVAQRYPAVCAMELRLLRQAMPDAEVTRVAHTMAGDPVCAYRIRARVP